MLPKIRKKTKRPYKCLKIGTLLFFLIAISIYFSLPQVLSSLAKGYLLTQGVETSSLNIHYPGRSGLEIKEFSGTIRMNDQAVEFHLTDAELSYHFLASLIFTPENESEKNLTINSLSIKIKELESKNALKEKVPANLLLEVPTRIILAQDFINTFNSFHEKILSYILRIKEVAVTYEDLFSFKGSLELRNGSLLSIFELESSALNHFKSEKTYIISSDMSKFNHLSFEIKEEKSDIPLLKTTSNMSDNKINLQIDSYPGKLCTDVSMMIGSTSISCKENIYFQLKSDIKIKQIASDSIQGINLNYTSEANGLSIQSDFFSFGLMSADGTVKLKNTRAGLLIEKGRLSLSGLSQDAIPDKDNPLVIYSFKSETTFHQTPNSLMFETMVNDLDISSPIPIKNILLQLKGRLETKDNKLEIALKEGQGQIFDGTVRGFSDRIFPLDKSSEILLEIERLSLREILALYPTQIEGIGEINGSIPLTLNSNGFSVSNGRLESEKGGIIRYKGKIPGISDNQNIQFISQALENYHYESLDSTLDYLPDGTLQIAVGLKGNNPQLMNGRQINFNLNVEENIPALLKSLSIAKEITSEVSKAHARKSK